MNYSEFKQNLGQWVTLALIVKLMAFGFSYAECFGALVLLVSLHGSKVIDYYLPKRPDINAALELLEAEIKRLSSKSEELEQGVSSLQMERLRK